MSSTSKNRNVRIDTAPTLAGDVEDEKTTVSKGDSLEKEFGAHMKQNLNWHTVRVGAHLKGKINDKGAKVDIIGGRLDERGQRFKSVGKAYLIICFILIVAGLTIGYSNEDQDLAMALVWGGAFFEIIGFIAIAISIKLNKENVLVECKNLKGKVNINQIDKSIRELKDYRESGDKEYKFVKHYFVSTSGYMENALKHAQQHGIVCFEKKNGKFEIATWDNI